MSNRRYLIHNQHFIEYCYRRFRAATQDELNMLDHKERRIFQNEVKLHSFCKIAPKEQLDYLLVKIGVEFVQVYGPSEEAIAQNIFNTWDINKYPQKRADVTNRMAEQGIFATGSTEQMMSLQMAVQNGQTKIYNQSQRAQELINLKKSYNKMRTYDNEINEAQNAYDWFNKVLLLQMNSFSWVKEHMGIGFEELRILAVLFDKRSTAIRYYELSEQVQMVGDWKYIKGFLDNLMERKFIQADRVVKEGKYHTSKCWFMISAMGIAKMVEYRNYIHELVKKIK